MKRKSLNSLKVILISALSLVMVACGSSKTTITSDDFAINTSKIESDNGSYNIVLEFYEKASKANYTIYENDKEIKSGRKDEIGKDSKEFIFTDKASGEYLYTVKVEDENSGITSKEVKVKVKNSDVYDTKIEDDKENVDKKNETEASDKIEESKEAPWNKESVDYKVKDKVSYKSKTYECIQGHTSQEAWTPLDSPSLWKVQENN
ncbi:MAG: carbohydrate-binding protein [Clostridium sp.]